MRPAGTGRAFEITSRELGPFQEPTANTSLAHSQGGDVKEAWAVGLLALGCGLVGVDRYMLLPMFPILKQTFHLGYQEVGTISGSLAMTYGASALFMGWLCDRIGRRRVVVGSAVAFSLLVGVTGLANGFLALCALRALMGLADGGFMTSSIAANIEISGPKRQGRNLGIQLMMIPLFGLALSPILATQLLRVMSWRWILFLVTPIGLLTSFGLYRVLAHENGPGDWDQSLATDTPEGTSRWLDLFGYRNVRICMAGMVCWLSVAVSLSSLLPNYLIDNLHLSVGQMGFVLSATGFGGASGNLVMPFLSDRIGRKAVALSSAGGAIFFIAVLTRVGASPGLLFAALFLADFFIFALVSMTIGPAVVEAVPRRLMASATGLVLFMGELLGGGIGPVVAGYVAGHFGVRNIFVFVTVALAAGFVAFLFLQETAPLLLDRRKRHRGVLRPSA